MPSKDKRKLAAIMFADVVGYSRMMASNEERTLELLKDFENICSPIISKHEGEIIKKVGDELFCEFSSAKQAVDSALAIQNAIQPYNDSRPKDFKLQVRIGIHIGDIVIRDGDVFGDGVNGASRIQPFASPGGICISSAVKEVITPIKDESFVAVESSKEEVKEEVEMSPEIPSEGNPTPAQRRHRLAWAVLLARVWAIDVTECPAWGGRMKIVAAVTDPCSIRRYLEGVGLPARAPPIAPARPQRQQELDLQFAAAQT